MKKSGMLLYPLLLSLIFVGSTAAHVILDNPLGGETFIVGERVNIRWHTVIPHDQENWDLYFSPDGGANWETIQLNIRSSQLNYLWTVPPVVTGQARIRIYMDNTGQGYDDISGDFIIQGTTSIQAQDEYPQIFALYPNYPNPFNPSTSIAYQLFSTAEIQLQIYNPLGQPVKSLVDEKQAAGNYQVRWDGRDNQGDWVPSGIYLFRLTAGTFTRTRQMVLSR